MGPAGKKVVRILIILIKQGRYDVMLSVSWLVNSLGGMVHGYNRTYSKKGGQLDYGNFRAVTLHNVALRVLYAVKSLGNTKVDSVQENRLLIKYSCSDRS